MTAPADKLPEDDAELWDRLAKGVKVYEREGRLIKASALPARTNSRKKQKAATKPSPPMMAAPKKTPVRPIDLRSGDHAGIDRSTRRRLAQGQLPIEARLDLHGLNAEQAERRLNNFLNVALANGLRVVLVITGKGQMGQGVLRKLVPEWLKSGPLSSSVLAISTAQPSDGGAGALYVMLRRKRGAP